MAGPVLNPALEALLSVLVAAREPLHFRSLSRLSALSLNSLRRELERLEGAEALERSKLGNRVLYRLRRTAPVTLSLRQLLALQRQDTPWDRFPATRENEEKLVKLCAHVGPVPEIWRNLGDPDFLSGLAVWLSGHTGFDRGLYLALAEALKPGASDVEAFQAWHSRYGPGAARFFAALDRERQKHARVTD